MSKSFSKLAKPCTNKAGKSQKESSLAWIPVFALFFLTLLPLIIQAQPEDDTTVADIERISLGSGGVQSNGSSFFSYVSGDNRYATFHSWASNFGAVEGDENWLDIFYRDRQTNTTIKISNGHNGAPTNEDSFDAVITADGRYVVYTSYAWNLVPHDTNRDDWARNGLDVFLYDAVTQKTERVSVTSSGNQINDNSFGTITASGTYIYFVTNSSGIVPGASTAGSPNIYRRDRDTFSSVELITTMNPNGLLIGLSPSYDGRYLVFSSLATNLVPGDTNGQQDVFLYDYDTKEMRIVSLAPDGAQSNGLSGQGSISQDGRFTIFRSFATNLVPGDTNGQADIFVYDHLTGAVERVSVSSSGAQSNADNRDPSICGNGRYVSFSSNATNLVNNDSNGTWDVFIHDRETGETFIASVNSSGALTNKRVHRSFLSPDCHYITYASDGDNIVPGDTNDARDLFMSRIVRTAAFSPSIVSLSLTSPGNPTTFNAVLRNSGTESAAATLIVPIPAHTTLVPATLPTGASFNSGENQVEWQGNIPGETEVVISFDLTVDPGLIDFTIIKTTTTLTGDGQVHKLPALTAVNGMHTYFPFLPDL